MLFVDLEKVEVAPRLCRGLAVVDAARRKAELLDSRSAEIDGVVQVDRPLRLALHDQEDLPALGRVEAGIEQSLLHHDRRLMQREHDALDVQLPARLAADKGLDAALAEIDQVARRDHAVGLVHSGEQQLVFGRNLAELADDGAGDHPDRPLEALTVDGQEEEAVGLDDDELAADAETDVLVRANVFESAVSQELQHHRLLRRREARCATDLRAGRGGVMDNQLTKLKIFASNFDRLPRDVIRSIFQGGHSVPFSGCAGVVGIANLNELAKFVKQTVSVLEILSR